MQSPYYYITHILPTLGSILKRMHFLFHNDERYLRLLFFLKIGAKMDFKYPKRFNEKLQWLKLFNHNPKYTDMVDKYRAKMIVEEQIGENHVIPTIGVWNSIEEIDWNILPTQFVLKTTHGGGGVGVVVCRGEKEFNRIEAIKKLNRSMNVSGYDMLKEWPYKNVQRRILAEQYIEDVESHQLVDYKFHCFNGKAKLVLVCRDRYARVGGTKDFYDMEWRHMDIRRELKGNSKSEYDCPQEFDQMKDIAETLSKDIPFVRIDLYLANHTIYFGEYTFFPASGLSRFYPDKWDYVIGGWLELPQTKLL